MPRIITQPGLPFGITPAQLAAAFAAYIPPAPAIDEVLAAGSNAEQHQLINLKSLTVSRDASGIAINVQNTNTTNPNSVALCDFQYAIQAGGMVSLDNGAIVSDGYGDLTINGTNVSDSPTVAVTDTMGNSVLLGDGNDSGCAIQTLGPGGISFDNQNIYSDGLGNLAVNSIAASAGFIMMLPSNPPTSHNAPGIVGTFLIGHDSYLYYCLFNNRWVRTALTTW